MAKLNKVHPYPDKPFFWPHINGYTIEESLVIEKKLWQGWIPLWTMPQKHHTKRAKQCIDRFCKFHIRISKWPMRNLFGVRRFIKYGFWRSVAGKRISYCIKCFREPQIINRWKQKMRREDCAKFELPGFKAVLEWANLSFFVPTASFPPISDENIKNLSECFLLRFVQRMWCGSCHSEPVSGSCYDDEHKILLINGSSHTCVTVVAGSYSTL